MEDSMTIDMTQMLGFSMMSGGGSKQQPTTLFEVFTQAFHTLLQVMLVASITHIQGLYTTFVAFVKEKVREQTEKQTAFVTDKLSRDAPVKDETFKLNHNHAKYTLSLSYTLDKESKDVTTGTDKVYLDALLHHFSKIHNIASMHTCKHEFIPTCLNQPFYISPDIVCSIERYSVTLGNVLESCKMRLTSSLTCKEIICFMDSLVKAYETDKSSDLNTSPQIFIIKQSGVSQSVSYHSNTTGGNAKENLRQAKQMAISTAPKTLEFTKRPFHSNKAPSNVLGETAKTLFQKLDFFQNNREWYSKKGIPYHFTALLSGEPGVGKTSSIKAVSNKLKKHVFIVDCSKIVTSTQFQHLFYDETVHVDVGGSTTTFNIPIEDRMYILEELDILGNVLLDRKYKLVEENPVPGELTLDDFLNLLDGNNETPGRTIIMTSNYPERLDKALVRGGRVDINAKFKYPTNQEIVEYAKFFYDTDSEVKLDKDVELGLSYADVCQVCFLCDFESLGDKLTKASIEKKTDGKVSKESLESLVQQQEAERKKMQESEDKEESDQEDLRDSTSSVTGSLTTLGGLGSPEVKVESVEQKVDKSSETKQARVKQVQDLFGYNSLEHLNLKISEQSIKMLNEIKRQQGIQDDKKRSQELKDSGVFPKIVSFTSSSTPYTLLNQVSNETLPAHNEFEPAFKSDTASFSESDVLKFSEKKCSISTT